MNEDYPDWYTRAFADLMGPAMRASEAFAKTEGRVKTDPFNWADPDTTDRPDRIGNADNMEPRYPAVDAGIILSKSITITKFDMFEGDLADWNAVTEAISELPNLVVDELIPSGVYHIYNRIPDITGDW